MFMRAFIVIVCAASLAASCACARSNGRAGSFAVVAPEALRPLSGARAARVSDDKTDAAEPAVAAARDGTAFVAWVEHGVGGAADVRLAHVDGEGRLLAPPARVNAQIGAATAWRGDPPTVAVAPDGGVFVGWTARDTSPPRASSLEVSSSRDGGHTFAAPVKVNDDARPGAHGMHSLAVSPQGHLYVAWLDERDAANERADANSEGHHMGPDAAGEHADANAGRTGPDASGRHSEGNRELFFASSTDGGRTFSANRGVAKEACPCCKTALAVAPDGRVYVSWRQVLPGEFRHIAVASTTDEGKTFSRPVVVSDDRWQIAGCPVSGPALTVGPDGALRVLWYAAGEGSHAGLYWTESGDGGRTFAPRRPFVERSASSSPALVRGDGGVVSAIWEDRSAGAARVVSAGLGDAAPAAEGGVLAGAGELPAASSAGGRTFAAYMAGDDGRREVWIVGVADGARGGS